MKKIKLSRGKYALVDNSQFDFLNQWKWNCSQRGYARRYEKLANGKRRNVLMHRVVLGIIENKELVGDHLDGNKLNNCENNLRACTQSENMINVKRSGIGTSKYLGVVFCKERKNRKYRARISFNGKAISLGCHPTELQAAKCYDKKAKELHGEFANLNFNRKNQKTK